jgi:energy-coupling factor transport system ATP-binding protein
VNGLGSRKLKNTRYNWLSTGERMRLVFAKAMLNHPKVIIMDEPTIGQDYQQKEKLRQFIIQMQTQRKTVVIVTHDVEFVAECNPRVVLMKEGQIVADGEGKDILTNPEALAQSSIVLPQIAQIFKQLTPLGLPKNIIDIYEAKDMLLRTWRKSENERF